MNKGNSTTNAILVILLVIVVAFAVWYMTMRTATAPVEDGANIELNLGGSSGQE
ncbi:MAG: hypothetical protein AAB365_02720 [Patescibacteria group bacterium]